MAMSGGSLPSFLRGLSKFFEEMKVDPQFSSWHILLADERCVVVGDPDSNLGAIQKEVLDKSGIPSSNVHGINEEKLDSPEEMAKEYEETVKNVLLQSCGGKLDLALLGFGPDGHTCSLFPEHDLLSESDKLVASIENSPKPPPNRITMTFPLLNASRNVIFCGAGSSKAPILKEIFESVGEPETDYDVAGGLRKSVVMKDPAPFPCGMVRPNIQDSTLTWIVDADAMGGNQ